MDIMDKNRLIGWLENIDQNLSEIALIANGNVPEHIEGLLWTLNAAWWDAIEAVYALGRNPQDIQKGERDG